jgi:CBS domain-containing protein
MSTQTPDRSCSVGAICQRKVVSIAPSATVVAAAELMRSTHIGCLLVTEPLPDGGGSRVVGTLTDRDIVVSVVARNADPTTLTAGDVMSHHPLMVSEESALDAALGFMEEAGVRRIVVTGKNGELVGILSSDDIMQRLSRQMAMLCGAFSNEMKTERLVRP